MSNEILNIVWFKRDLRTVDHAPLFNACKQGKVLPLFIIETEYWKLPDSSRLHWFFIHDCLNELNHSLVKLGGRLIIKTGEAVTIFNELYNQLGKFSLWSHEETGNNWTFQRDKEVLKWCRNHAIKWQEFPTNCVVRKLPSRNGWSDIRAKRMSQPALAEPDVIAQFHKIAGGTIPSKHDPLFGDAIIANVQKGGRSEALRTLSTFLNERSVKYLQTISKPGYSARHSSRLSPHITFGTISIKEIEQMSYAKIKALQRDNLDNSGEIKNILAFLSRIAWHCHFVQKLEQQPEIEFHCMHPAFEGIRESDHNEQYFTAWKTGNTGYPLVDASMRSLHENGWINFRMRAMLVSFASYHLWLDWRKTAPFLARLFTDYEPGIHYSQFQMQSGVTGINTIRIYNPIKQSEDHDSEGKFIKRYVKELADVPSEWIHQPNLMPPLLKIGNKNNYPEPIVNNQQAMREAKRKLALVFKQPGFKEEAKQVHQKLGSRAKHGSKKQAPEIKTNQLEFKF